VTDLPSLALLNGDQALGPHDISFQGRGGAYIPIGLGANPAARSLIGPSGSLLGTLLHASASGHWRAVAGVSAYEAAVNPGGGPVDSNPYGALAEPGARLIVDAGANALLQVRTNGDVSTLAVFPSRPARATDSVPTSVAVGPDGAYYVGELTGAPFAAGAARVYRVTRGSAPIVHLTGFTTIINLAFGLDGSLYVLEHSTGPGFFALPGRLIRVAPDGSRSTVLDHPDRPTSVVVDPQGGSIYITNHGITAGAGVVMRVDE
jgi:sugar lactone lactonase YvrE